MSDLIESISNMWMIQIEYFKTYMGDGLLMTWFLLSWLYLFFMEKRKSLRVLFVYLPMMVMLLFFQPTFAWIIHKVVGEEVYYRILWLLPITIVIAFTITSIYEKLQGRVKYFFALVAAVLVLVSGSFIYHNPYFHKAENLYHVPQAVVDICEAIKVEGREVKAVFPRELLQYVRQYDPVVVMPYGRDVLVERWNAAEGNDLYAAMEADVIDAKRLSELARVEWCAYIVLAKEREMKGSLETYQFTVFDEIGDYVIYKDATVDLRIEF